MLKTNMKVQGIVNRPFKVCAVISCPTFMLRKPNQTQSRKLLMLIIATWKLTADSTNMHIKLYMYLKSFCADNNY